LNNKELQIDELISPTVESLDCFVWGIEYINQGKQSVLRVFIDRLDGINVDLCAEVSRSVSDLLDVEEVMPSAYTLEVSSPGMDRLLFRESQYIESIGEKLEVRLNIPFEGRKKNCWSVGGFRRSKRLVAGSGRRISAAVRKYSKGTYCAELWLR
jgi:ribosome maturation factor RimP